MKKVLPVVIVLLVLESLCMHASAQRRKNQEQLYLMSTEVIKADMVDEFIQARKELISVCQETGFPHPFILWSSRDNYCHIWYPIDEMNDINRIDKAWNAFAEEYGSTVVKPYMACVETSITKVMVAHLDLSYEPAELRLTEDETKFCRLQYLYLKKNSGAKVKALVKELLELYESKGVTSGVYYGEGEIGFEKPLLLNWMFARDLQDYLEQEDKITELLGAHYKDLLNEISHYVRKTETLDFKYLDDLSYNLY